MRSTVVVKTDIEMGQMPSLAKERQDSRVTTSREGDSSTNSVGLTPEQEQIKVTISNIFENPEYFKHLVKLVYDKKSQCNRQFTQYAQGEMRYDLDHASDVAGATALAGERTLSSRVIRTAVSTAGAGATIAARFSPNPALSTAATVVSGAVFPFKDGTYSGSIATGDFVKIATAIVISAVDNPAKKQELFENYIKFTKTGEWLKRTAMMQLGVAMGMIASSAASRIQGGEDENANNANVAFSCAYCVTNLLSTVLSYNKTRDANHLIEEMVRDVKTYPGDKEINDDDVLKNVLALESGAKGGVNYGEAFAAVNLEAEDAKNCLKIGKACGLWESAVHYGAYLGGKQLIDFVSKYLPHYQQSEGR
jgi:hypothetical protein